MSETPLLDPLRLDLEVIRETLRQGKASEHWLSSWLPSTYAAPDRFREALYGYVASKRAGALKSRAAEGADLYHDCVLAHLGRRRTAIVARERESTEWVSLSFESLHHRCSALMTAWARAGLVAGTSVCVVLPVGVEYAVAVLTALRMGLVVSTLPPTGPTFVRHRLEALAPDHVISSDRYRKMIGRPAEAILLTTSDVREAAAQVSHTYAPGEVALRLFTPFRGEILTPVDVPGPRLFESVLRDGLFAYGLEPSDTLAAPGFDPTQSQPTLLLTALAAGATYAELGAREVEADPKLLERFQVSVLGITNHLRDVLLEKGADVLRASCRAWFRSLTDVLDVNVWDALGRRMFERKIFGFNVVMNAATGGTPLFGARTLQPPSLRVWPALGQEWLFSEVAAGVVSALNDVGVYTVLSDGEEDVSFARCIVSRLGDGYIFAGTIDLGPRAQTYPSDEIEAVAAKHPGVRHAAVALAGGRWVNEAKVILLTFVDAPEPGAPAEPPLAIPELQARIAREMGEHLLPFRIEVFPLRPRFTYGEGGTVTLDRAWCRSQYLSGALTEKSRSELFVTLARLGYIFAGAPPNE